MAGLPSRKPCRSVSKNPAENLLYLFLIRNIRVKWVAKKQKYFSTAPRLRAQADTFKPGIRERVSDLERLPRGSLCGTTAFARAV
jgi:hypothetical protein